LGTAADIVLSVRGSSCDISHKYETLCFFFSFFPDKTSEFAPCKAMVHHVRFDVMLFHPITRKLINESNGTFLAGQKLIEKAGGIDTRGDLLKLSRQYR
jgi:hypothetical protein